VSNVGGKYLLVSRLAVCLPHHEPLTSVCLGFHKQEEHPGRNTPKQCWVSFAVSETISVAWSAAVSRKMATT
jgi:hypothetical protein